MPESDSTSDFFQKWEKARQKILREFALFKQLILSASQSVADKRNLENSMPHEIVEYYISQMIKLK